MTGLACSCTFPPCRHLPSHSLHFPCTHTCPGSTPVPCCSAHSHLGQSRTLPSVYTGTSCTGYLLDSQHWHSHSHTFHQHSCTPQSYPHSHLESHRTQPSWYTQCSHTRSPRLHTPRLFYRILPWPRRSHQNTRTPPHSPWCSDSHTIHYLDKQFLPGWHCSASPRCRRLLS